MKRLILFSTILITALSLCIGFAGCTEEKAPIVTGPTYAPPTAEPMTEGVSLEFVSYTGGTKDQISSIKVKWSNSSDVDVLVSPTGKLNRSNNGLFRELGDVNSRKEAIKLAVGESLEMEYFVDCSGTEMAATYMIKTTYEKLYDDGGISFPASVSFEK